MIEKNMIEDKSPNSEEVAQGSNHCRNTGVINRVLFTCSLLVASPRTLLVSGILISSGLILEGLLCFTFCTGLAALHILFLCARYKLYMPLCARTANTRSYILSFYYVLFGLLSIAMEFRFRFIAMYFKVLLDFPGRGIWYLFLATLAFGS